MMKWDRVLLCLFYTFTHLPFEIWAIKILHSLSQDLSQQTGEQIDRQSNHEIFTFIFRNECIFHLLQKLACPSIYRSFWVVVRPFFPCVCSYFRICSHFGFFTLHHGNFSIDTVASRTGCFTSWVFVAPSSFCCFCYSNPGKC